MLADLQREPWMDMPLQQMTKQQREELQAFEKLVKEHAEQRANARRALELERKGIDEECINSIQAFNVTLHKLHYQFLDVCMVQTVIQQQQLDLAALIQQSYDSLCLGQQVDRSTLELKQHLALLGAALKTAKSTADGKYGRFLVCSPLAAPQCCGAEHMTSDICTAKSCLVLPLHPRNAVRQMAQCMTWWHCIAGAGSHFKGSRQVFQSILCSQPPPTSSPAGGVPVR
jgi:hypothetical protein